MTTHNDESLKPCPCPWCGSTNVATRPDDAQGTKWGFAYCADCGVRGPEVRTGYKMADDAPWRWDALVAWNDRRAPQGNAAQEGYALVPVEPTDDMIANMCAAHEFSQFYDLEGPMKDAYKAMIAAAPSNKKENDDLR